MKSTYASAQKVLPLEGLFFAATIIGLLSQSKRYPVDNNHRKGISNIFEIKFLKECKRSETEPHNVISLSLQK